MSKGLRVSPGELGEAARVLQGVGSELGQSGDLGVDTGDLGSQELAIALADFCQKAQAVAVAMSSAVYGAGLATGRSAAAYGQTEMTIATGFHGHF
jgi:hypothetical protein